jgi:EF hand
MRLNAMSNISTLLCMTALTLCAQFQSSPHPDDANRDGVLTRDEWRGDARSFREQDRNRDGVLSGNEVPGSFPGNRRNSAQESSRERDSDDQRPPGVSKLDKNRSGVVEGYEWPYNAAMFHKLDRDGNSVLSQDELKNITSATMIDLDRNNDQRIEPDEWPGGFAEFDRLDENGDGSVSSSEYFNRGGEFQRRQRFTEWDTNRDGIISSTEWRSRPDLFHKLDTSGDSQLSWQEFMASTERYDRPFGWRDRNR